MMAMVRVEIFTAICLSGHADPAGATDRMPEATGFSAKRRADLVSGSTQPTWKALDRRPISRAPHGLRGLSFDADPSSAVSS